MNITARSLRLLALAGTMAAVALTPAGAAAASITR